MADKKDFNPQMDAADVRLATLKTIYGKHDIRLLQMEVVHWADRQFPNRKWENTFNKLRDEEIQELFENPKDPSEYADVFILLLDLANMAGLSSDNLTNAIRDKLIINKNRKWIIDADTNIARHLTQEP